MKSVWTKLHNKITTFCWAYRQAWNIDKRMLLLWLGLSIALSVLPAASLYFNREIVSGLSEFITFGRGEYKDVFAQVVWLGILLTLIGLSARANEDLIYMMMYDSYYVGMQEILMDRLQKIPIIDLLSKEWNDEYNFVVGRAGSLTDLMSGSCVIIGKLTAICSLLVVALSASRIIFWISLFYVMIILFINFTYTEKIRWNAQLFRKDERRAKYFEMLPMNTDSAKEIRIFENTDFVIGQWKDSYEKVLANEKSRIYAMELRSLASNVVFYLFLIVVVFYLLWQVSAGTLTVSVFLMIYSLSLSIYTAISGLARSIIRFDYGLFALERQCNFLKSAPCEDAAGSHGIPLLPKRGIPAFSVRDVSFAYNGNAMALQHINLEIEPGEVIAIVGENGSGKTTLSKLLLGMYQPTSGTISLFGRPYGEYSLEEVRSRIGVFFQNFCLLHASIKENVAYGDIRCMEKEEMIRQAIEKGGAKKIVDRLPDGIETILGKQVYKNGVELSGGQKYCIAVSRAHMNEKEILILDEPSAALDPLAELSQFMNIKNTLKDRTAILISHRIGFARMADKIIMMDQGRIVETGMHEDLIKKGGLYAHFFQEQAKWYQGEDAVKGI